jgi:large subunit ribosomal protein L25
MQENFEIIAVAREDAGKGASRRLRREGMVPGIIYGGDAEPQMVSTKHNVLLQHLEHEAFYSHILTVKVDGKAQKVVLRDLQRHPAKPFVTHFDLQRVSASERLKMNVPLHFLGEDTAPGVKAGGDVSHNMTDIEVICLAKDLPEYIEVDLSGLEIGDVFHLSSLVLPAGVELTAHVDEEHDLPVAAIHAKRVAVEEEGEAGEAGEAAEPAAE